MTTQREAEVVIIGGGVMGASAAHHLAAAGVSDLVLLEACELASGSSGKPLGGVRAQFSDPVNVELGARSLDAFHRFPEEFGVDIGLEQVGYLFLLREADQVERFEHSVTMQNELGVPSRIISSAEAHELCPYAPAEHFVAAAWSGSDGYARPETVVTAYAASAARRGAEIRTGSAVAGMEATGDDRVAVRTEDGCLITTPTVVCTAGAWSTAIGAMAGVSLPIEPLRRQVAFTAPMDPPPPRIPFSIDYSTTAYFHRSDDGGLLFGLSDPAQEPGFDTSISTEWHAPLRRALARCAPTLADVELVRGWSGLYEMTPDCNAMIGEATPQIGSRFLYATGFSGHGFLQGPAVGEILRDLYLGRDTVVDVSGFDAARFESADVARTEANII